MSPSHQLTKRAPTEGLGLRGQATPLGVGEAEPAGGELFAQHSILCLEIVDDVALLLVDPAGHGDDEELQRWGSGHMVTERSRGPARRPRLTDRWCQTRTVGRREVIGRSSSWTLRRSNGEQKANTIPCHGGMEPINWGRSGR